MRSPAAGIAWSTGRACAAGAPIEAQPAADRREQRGRGQRGKGRHVPAVVDEREGSALQRSAQRTGGTHVAESGQGEQGVLDVQVADAGRRAGDERGEPVGMRGDGRAGLGHGLARLQQTSRQVSVADAASTSQSSCGGFRNDCTVRAAARALRSRRRRFQPLRGMPGPPLPEGPPGPCGPDGDPDGCGPR